MKLAVVSDTHGNLENTRVAISMIKELEVDIILHCGDIGSTLVIPFFDDWPTHFVFGNCDANRNALEEAIHIAEQSCHGEFGEFELEGKEIALLHSHDDDKFVEVMYSGQYDLVCYGHTHQQGHFRHGKTLILNPGALFRARPLSFAVVNLPELTVEYHALPEK